MSFVDSAAGSAPSANDEDLDPAAWLKSVRELSEKREREDAERFKKLEEEVSQGRRERAARRAERARSISPEKASITRSNTFHSSGNVKRLDSVATPAAMDPPAPESPTKDIPEFTGFARTSTESTAPARASSSASDVTHSASSLARSGTLSWQQRRGVTSRGTAAPTARPQSMFLPEATRPTSVNSSTSRDDSEPSRDQIAASLASRDPAWFRQTPDRGLGNAAYRKSQEESTGGDRLASGRRGLPGLSREGSPQIGKDDSPARAGSTASETALRAGAGIGSAASSTAFSTVRSSASSRGDLRSLIAADQEQEDASPISSQTQSHPDADQPGVGRTLTMSTSQARIANVTERPASPTKGMGGFVQSAMMKRSDSVNKRWSAQPGSSLSRENSSKNAGLTGSYSMPKLEPTPINREDEPIPRPSSSSNNFTNATPTHAGGDDTIFAKPTLPSSHSRNKSIASTYSTTAEEGHTSPPSSPSKRWSPSKSRSTWLESAITKPDSPKPTPAPRNSQPSWMADIAKAKAQRASVDSTPKPTEDVSSRPGSPTKTPFGQGMLKRSESRDGTPRVQTPKSVEEARSRPSSPTKTNNREDMISRSPPKDAKAESGFATPATSMKPDASDEAMADSRVFAAQESPSRVEDDLPESNDAQGGALVAAKGPPATQDSKHGYTSSVSSTSGLTKPKPETPPKPQTDFRHTLRPRAPTGSKEQAAPEFLSKFGNLKKTQTQNYVAPDLLKDNILRGKSDLAKTGGPVKTQRRDELKESLLAKKEQWKTEREEGIVHERKTSNPPKTPQKPEALAKRELLGRSESTKTPASSGKLDSTTPEAVARHRSLKNPGSETTLPGLEKQKSAPTGSGVVSGASSSSETSKLAARFNPGLANILARGPPAATNESNAASRSRSPGIPKASSTSDLIGSSEPPSNTAQLQDMRKDRAKGPKRRKGGTPVPAQQDPPASRNAPSTATAATLLLPDEREARASDARASDAQLDGTVSEKPKPRAPPGSAASLMLASLKKPEVPSTEERRAEESDLSKSNTSSTTDTLSNKPPVPAKSPILPTPTQRSNAPVTPAIPTSTPRTAMSTQDHSSRPSPAMNDVAEFQGFGSRQKSTPSMRLVEDDKENAGQSSPSVKSAATLWGRPSSPKKPTAPAQIQLPSKKDEEAAMRSAGLLASSPSRPDSSNGVRASPDRPNGGTEYFASSPIPPKPTKSSRAVSGQLQESPDKGSSTQPAGPIERKLEETFGRVPSFSGSLSVDVHALVSSSPHQERTFRTIRKCVYAISADGSLNQLQPQEEYTFFDHGVYACHHTYTIAIGPKKNEIFLWVGASSTASAVEQAQIAVKKMAKEAGNAFIHTLRQGMEPPGVLQALGGILVTRKGAGQGASKQYMLCGRKHLGQIVFDEVDFGVESLCSGYPYLISHPVTLQDTKMYLWKGSACSTEEVSAARLAAMGLSESGDIIEVDDGAEFASFLKIFGPGTTKASVPKSTDLWQAKATAPEAFSCRLFCLRPEENKQGFFGGMFARRPSWNSQSPSRKQTEDVRVDAQEVSPFTQMDLDVDGIYLLDAYSRVYLLIGPMFASHAEAVRNVLFGQMLMLASEYALVVTSAENRQTVPRGYVVLSGTPEDVKTLFRQWDEGVGLWGTAGLMAGSKRQDKLDMLSVDEVADVVCTE